MQIRFLEFSVVLDFSCKDQIELKGEIVIVVRQMPNVCRPYQTLKIGLTHMTAAAKVLPENVKKKKGANNQTTKSTLAKQIVKQE